MGLTKKQQKLRRTGIGGSEIAAVAGISPFEGPIDVYCRKLGLVPDVTIEESHHLQRGVFLEPAIRKWYAWRTGHKVKQPGTLVHPQHSVVLATPDGLIDTDDGPRVLEIKAPQHPGEEWGEDGTDEVPDYYRAQVTWEMAVAGAVNADLVPFYYGDIRVHPVQQDPEYFEVLLDMALRFWRDHVLKQVPPPMDASQSARDYLQRQYPKAVDDFLEVSALDVECRQSVTAWAEQYRRACDVIKAAEVKKEEARNKLVEVIGHHEGLIGEWGRITYRNVKDRATVDVERLLGHPAVHVPPEVLDACTIVTPGSRRFMPRWSKQ